MPVLVEHHLASSVNPARLGAQLAAAALDVDALVAVVPERERAVLLGVVEEQRTLTRELSATSAGQLVETLRRARHLPMEDYPGDPEPMPMAVEAAAALAEGFRALDSGRAAAELAGCAAVAEGLPGRHGELAVELAQWSGLIWELAGDGRGGANWPRRVGWGPEPEDPRVAAPVALVLTTSFLVSAAMSLRLALHDATRTDLALPNWGELYGLVVRLLSWGQETAAGAVMLIEHLMGGSIGDERRVEVLDPGVAALQSTQAAAAAARVLYADAVASPLERVQGVARAGLKKLVERCEEHERSVARAIAG